MLMHDREKDGGEKTARHGAKTSKRNVTYRREKKQRRDQNLNVVHDTSETRQPYAPGEPAVRVSPTFHQRASPTVIKAPWCTQVNVRGGRASYTGTEEVSRKDEEVTLFFACGPLRGRVHYSRYSLGLSLQHLGVSITRSLFFQVGSEKGLDGVLWMCC